ncbi:C1QL [Mytilus coruscus]|uniref:C1QL n=1 Tax=Mytilus coruscus TaxID=42192 RepID=A0A6J8DIW7_MYTCO|nr:C1QL [Mytilus coruscus]
MAKFLTFSYFEFLSILLIWFLGYSAGNDVDNSTVQIPLLDIQHVPLVALFDTTNLNKVLTTYINDTVEKTTKDKISNMKNDLLKDINNDLVRADERPAFSASRTSSKTLGLNEVLTFDKVWLNIGNGYEPSTGVFTVPKDGIYFISNTVMSTKGKFLHCHLWKNNESNVGSFGTDYSSGTLNTVMALRIRDKIYIKHDVYNNESIYGGHWSMFSGFLIN